MARERRPVVIDKARGGYRLRMSSESPGCELGITLLGCARGRTWCGKTINLQRCRIGDTGWQY